MALSTQSATSDGTLTLLNVSISYIKQDDILVFYDDALANPSTWDWVGATSAISFSPAVPNGVVVLLRRKTQIDKVINRFAAGAAFTNESMDMDFRQMLNLAQEYTEGGSISDSFNNLNMHGFKVNNLGDGVTAADAVNKAQLDAQGVAVTASEVAAAASAAAALVSEIAAATSAGSATVSAGSATASASTATTQAGIATTKATEASNTVASLSGSSGSSLVGHVDTSPGSVARTVQDKLRDFPDHASGGFWPDGSPIGHIQRLYDRIFIGGATLCDGTLANVGKDWLETMRAFSTRNSQFAVTSTIGQGAIVGGSRTSDSPSAGSLGCIGIGGYANNNNVTQIQTGYAGYFEARRQAGAGITQTIEADIVNLGSVSPAYPGNVIPAGLTSCLWAASGGEVVGAATASLALGVIYNGAQFDKGIVFGSGAIAAYSGEATALAMAATQGIVWYDGTTNKIARIRSDATSSSVGIVFSNGQINFQDMSGVNLAILNTSRTLQFNGAATVSSTGALTLDGTSITLTGVATANSANAGGFAVPATAAKFVTITAGGVTGKIPLYAV